MSRHDTYASSSPRGFFVPRWLVALGGGALMLWFGWSMMSEPAWVVQRLESPTGGRTAFLKRVIYVSHYYQIDLRQGISTRRIFRSPALEVDYKRDARERLLWSEDGRHLYFTLQGRVVWGWSVEQTSELTPEALGLAQEKEQNRICR
jgi:hypothetical protein